MPNTPVTEYADRALTELFHHYHVVWWLKNILKREEGVLQEHNKRAVPAGLKPATNKPFDDAASEFFGKSLLCQAVDVYNSYCQETLQLAIANDPNVQPALHAIKKFREQFERAQKLNTDPATELLTLLQTRYVVDSTVRKAIHLHLRIEQFPETELLCLCRNIIVHKRGIDRRGEIAAMLTAIGSDRAFIGAQDFPDGHLPITLRNGALVCGQDVGLWAASLMQQQIFLMDQEFAHKHNLPRQKRPSATIGRTYVQ